MTCLKDLNRLCGQHVKSLTRPPGHPVFECINILIVMVKPDNAVFSFMTRLITHLTNNGVCNCLHHNVRVGSSSDLNPAAVLYKRLSFCVKTAGQYTVSNCPLTTYLSCLASTLFCSFTVSTWKMNFLHLAKGLWQLTVLILILWHFPPLSSEQITAAIEIFCLSCSWLTPSIQSGQRWKLYFAQPQ